MAAASIALKSDVFSMAEVYAIYGHGRCAG
jgi:hypothetical protein